MDAYDELIEQFIEDMGEIDADLPEYVAALKKAGARIDDLWKACERSLVTIEEFAQARKVRP